MLETIAYYRDEIRSRRAGFILVDLFQKLVAPLS